MVLPAWVLGALAVSFLFLGLVSPDAAAGNTSSSVGHFLCDPAAGLPCSYDTTRAPADFPAVSMGQPVASFPYMYDASALAHALAGLGSSSEGVSFEVVTDGAGIAASIVADGAATTLAASLVTPSGLADDAAQLALPRGGANLSQQRLDHIIARHWHGSQTANAGHFASGTTGRGLTSMIDDTVRGGTFRPNTAGRPGTIFEHDLGRTIGTNAAGNSTSRLRVVVDPSGNVITAFPY